MTYMLEIVQEFGRGITYSLPNNLYGSLVPLYDFQFDSYFYSHEMKLPVVRLFL